MRTMVTALLESVVHIINVFVVVVIVWLMFAIIGGVAFGGKFFYCSIDKYRWTTEESCIKHDGEWKRYDHNFDSVPNGLLTLFIISTLEGWPDIMF